MPLAEGRTFGLVWWLPARYADRVPAPWDEDTAMGGRAGAFPATPASAVLGVKTDDPVVRARAFATIVRAYWKPVYKRVRLKFRKPNEEAKDLTQAFFARALERGVFDGFAPERARFRTYVRRCLDNFVLNEEEARRALKRGGGAMPLSLHFDEAEAELGRLGDVDEGMQERLFDEEWVKALVGMSVDALRSALTAEGRDRQWRAFEAYDLVDESERTTYAALAEQLGVKTTDVTNDLHAARKRFRRIVLGRLREITATEEEYRAEAIELLNIDPARA